MMKDPSDDPRPPPEPQRADGIDQLGLLPRFASVIAHELRNPLSAVKIALQTLERHADLPVKDGTRLRIALREVATIDRVLSEVLDWARPAKLEPSDGTVHALCDAPSPSPAPSSKNAA